MFFLISSDSSDLEKDSPVPVPQEAPPPPPMMEATEDIPPAFEMEVMGDAPSSVTPGEDLRISMVAPPSSLVASFDWSQFAGFRLPSYVPFEITVQALGLVNTQHHYRRRCLC